MGNMDIEENTDIKKIMHVMRHAPHGTIYSYEGLEMILIMAAYEQDLSVVFIGDGIYALKKNQDTHAIGIKGFSKPSWLLTVMTLKSSMSIGSLLKSGD